MIRLSVSDYLLIAIFSLWFLLSIAAQAKMDFIGKWNSGDLFRLIPNWRFFAPLPIRNDYHIEYRFLNDNEKKMAWCQCLELPERTFWCLFWYPEKRYRKTLTTAINRIKKNYEKSGKKRAVNTNSYLNILNYLQHQEIAASYQAIQFRIISRQDFVNDVLPQTVFVSRWHKKD